MSYADAQAIVVEMSGFSKLLDAAHKMGEAYQENDYLRVQSAEIPLSDAGFFFHKNILQYDARECGEGLVSYWLCVTELGKNFFNAMGYYAPSDVEDLCAA